MSLKKKKEQKKSFCFEIVFIHGICMCKTQENSNFLKKGKIVFSVKKTQNFSGSRMTKRISLLESSREI